MVAPFGQRLRWLLCTLAIVVAGCTPSASEPAAVDGGDAPTTGALGVSCLPFPEFDVRADADECRDWRRLVPLIDAQLGLPVPPRTFLLLACVVSTPPAPAALEPPCAKLVDDLDVGLVRRPDPARCLAAAVELLAFYASDARSDEASRVRFVDALTAGFEVDPDDLEDFEDDAAALRQADRARELATLDRYLATCLTS